jgi:hypothetical protein
MTKQTRRTFKSPPKPFSFSLSPEIVKQPFKILTTRHLKEQITPPNQLTKHLIPNTLRVELCKVSGKIPADTAKGRSESLCNCFCTVSLSTAIRIAYTN